VFFHTLPGAFAFLKAMAGARAARWGSHAGTDAGRVIALVAGAIGATPIALAVAAAKIARRRRPRLTLRRHAASTGALAKRFVASIMVIAAHP
jgi:hypothetical protein